MKRTKHQKDALCALRAVLVFQAKGLDGFAAELREDGLLEESDLIEKHFRAISALIAGIDHRLRPRRLP